MARSPFARLWNVIGRREAIAPALAVLITVYAALLRLDAFAGKYGTLDHPAWARVATDDIASRAAALRPASVEWKREARPYEGGDPINYLRFAREMHSFYQAHVREPVFLAVTRAWLWALDGQDAAVSFASLAGSTLAVFAIYLVGAAVMSPAAGLVAALLMAIEYEAIAWAPDGWRDDTFTATALFAVWALLRLCQRPSTLNAVLAGVLCGVSCLTRITALSFVVPGILWLIVAGAPSRREKVRLAAVAIGVLALVVAPFLISCALATGDPFFAINYHTVYYRHAEGQPISEPISAAEYLRVKLTERPIRTLDTSLEGLFLQPFTTKWNGFAPWLDGLGVVLQCAALVGIAALAVFSAAGRMLLFLLLTSLVPYVITWNVGDRAWRFTMHAYPFYIVAAACAFVGIARVGHRLFTKRPLLPVISTRQIAMRVGALAVVVVVAALGYFALPWFVVREGIANGDSTSVETGTRDLTFYREGWSRPRRDGIMVRVSRGRRSDIQIPLPVRRDYDVVLRIDPVDPAIPQRVGVLMNGHLVGRPQLSWDPTRVGSYRVRVPADLVRTTNELTIMPETLVAAGSAGPRFAWLDPADQIGVRLWYVRVLPVP